MGPFSGKAMFFWTKKMGGKLRFFRPGKPTQNAFAERTLHHCAAAVVRATARPIRIATLDVASKKYAVHIQFDNFVNGVYEGYSTVDREISLSPDGSLASGPVHVIRYLENGTVIANICGFAASTRL